MGAGPQRTHRPLQVPPAVGVAPFPYATAEDFDKAIKDRVVAAAATSVHRIAIGISLLIRIRDGVEA